MKKNSNILLRIFAYGITICLFAGVPLFSDMLLHL